MTSARRRVDRSRLRPRRRALTAVERFLYSIYLGWVLFLTHLYAYIHYGEVVTTSSTGRRHAHTGHFKSLVGKSLCLTYCPIPFSELVVRGPWGDLEPEDNLGYAPWD